MAWTNFYHMIKLRSSSLQLNTANFNPPTVDAHYLLKAVLRQPLSSQRCHKRLALFLESPTWLPFWISFLVPVAGTYLFNWVVFLVGIVYSLVRYAAKKEDSTVNMWRGIRHHFYITLFLSLFLSLGWVLGLIGTVELPSVVYLPVRFIFSVFIVLHGVLIFILHGLTSPDSPPGVALLVVLPHMSGPDVPCHLHYACLESTG